MTSDTPKGGTAGKPARERRRDPRALADFSIQIGQSPKAGVPGTERSPARLRDLSISGLCCFHPAPMTEMTLVHLTLRLPGDDRDHEVDGAVVRCAKLRGQTPPTYEVAVYFTEMTPETRAAIGSFVVANAAALDSES